MSSSQLQKDAALGVDLLQKVTSRTADRKTGGEGPPVMSPLVVKFSKVPRHAKRSTRHAMPAGASPLVPPSAAGRGLHGPEEGHRRRGFYLRLRICGQPPGRRQVERAQLLHHQGHLHRRLHRQASRPSAPPLLVFPRSPQGGGIGTRDREASTSSPPAWLPASGWRPPGAHAPPHPTPPPPLPARSPQPPRRCKA